MASQNYEIQSQPYLFLKWLKSSNFFIVKSLRSLWWFIISPSTDENIHPWKLVYEKLSWLLSEVWMVMGTLLLVQTCWRKKIRCNIMKNVSNVRLTSFSFSSLIFWDKKESVFIEFDEFECRLLSLISILMGTLIMFLFPPASVSAVPAVPPIWKL